MGVLRRVRAGGHSGAARRITYPANLPVALALVLAAAGSTAPAITSHHAGTKPASAPTAASVTVISPQRYPDGLPVLPPPVHIASTGSGHGATQVAVSEILLKAYRSAAAGAPPSCHLPASLLAAIGEVESGSLAGRTLNAQHRTSILGPVLNGKNGFRAVPDTDNGRLDGNRTWDRAMGPLQFIPSTWRTFGVDGDGDGVADPQDVEDATATAAAYLCYGGRDLSDPATLRAAVLAYNASSAYQQLVLTYQKRFASFGLDNDETSLVGLSLGAPGGPVAGQVLPGVFTDPSGAPTTGPGARRDRTKHQTRRAATSGHSGSASPTGTPSGGAVGGTDKHPTKSSTKGTSDKPSKDPTGKPSKKPTAPSGTPSGSGDPSGSPTDDPTTCVPPPDSAGSDPSAGPATDPSADPSPDASTDPSTADGSGDSSGDSSGDTATCPPCGTTGEPGAPSDGVTTSPSGDPSAEPGDPATCEPALTDPSSSTSP